MRHNTLLISSFYLDIEVQLFKLPWKPQLQMITTLWMTATSSLTTSS